MFYKVNGIIVLSIKQGLLEIFIQYLYIMDYSNLIVLTRHTTVWDDRCGEDKAISNCSLPLEWKLKCSTHYEHDELVVIAANMDRLHLMLAPKVIATVRQLQLNKNRHGKRVVGLQDHKVTTILFIKLEVTFIIL